MNILYIGSSGALSLLPFKQLISSPYTIVAVGLNNPIVLHNKIIALENESLALAASQLDIPLIDLTQSQQAIRRQCMELSVDVILMSCYNKRLPDVLINLAEQGCFNMHPSLLPLYRGPAPVFWQMKEASQLAVSWHRVIHDFDAGDIVAQQKVSVEEGASYKEINHRLANTGADLMLRLLAQLSTDTIGGIKQDPALASYYPYPSEHDFVIDTRWTAQHAYNFMRATRDFGYPYRCQIGSHCYLLDEAVDYDNNDTLPKAQVKADRLYIPCNEGVLVARFTAKL